MRARLLLALLTAALALALSACGGGGEGSSAPSPAAAPASTAPTPTGTPATPKRAAKAGSAKPPRSLKPAPPPALVNKAAKAAPFLVAKGDNSVPTYGAEASGSQRGQATAALSAYLSAREAGDWVGACAQLGAAVQKQLQVLARASGAKAKGCEAAYAKLSSRVPARERANPLVGSLVAFRVKGEHAFALFYGPAKQEYMMPMVSEGGTWRANQLAPVPWPLGAPAQASP